MPTSHGRRRRCSVPPRCASPPTAPSHPDHHRQLALRIAREFGLRHEFVLTSELTQPEYRANPVNRCYHCKTELYGVLSTLAAERGIGTIVDGSNADDRSDYRPGRQAARERGVRSPLDDANLTKADIRELSRLAGLPNLERARVGLSVLADSISL